MKDLFHHLYSARDGALRVLLAVELEQSYANLSLQKLLSRHRLQGVEAALLTELVYGTLRMQGRIDWVIDQVSSTPVAAMNPVIRNIIRLGCYQILFLERVPASAACNEAVKLAKGWKLGQLSGFVNAVLRNLSRSPQCAYPSQADDPIGYISVYYSHPHWLVERWLARFGSDETVALCRANNEVPQLSLRCNTLKLPPDRLQQKLAREGVESLPSPLVPEGVRTAHLSRITELCAFREGYFTVQDDSSMLTAIALQPAPGSVVVDACSGPGGKATHMAQLMRDRGKIIAFDIHEHRLQLIRTAARRLGVQIIETRLGDAGCLPDELRGQADALLVDAPCSGLGVIRRRPELRWRVKPEDLPQHHHEQLRILQGAAACLKQGGLLLYSTCSSEPEENSEVVSEFLERQPEFRVEDLSERLPFPLAEQEERDSARNGILQLLPHRQGIDGFFIALMRKS